MIHVRQVPCSSVVFVELSGALDRAAIAEIVFIARHQPATYAVIIDVAHAAETDGGVLDLLTAALPKRAMVVRSAAHLDGVLAAAAKGA